jgi:adenylyltransferase/sulfurtransferase
VKFSRRPESAAINLKTANPADYADLCGAGVNAISAVDLQQQLESGYAPFLLDVREPEEYAVKHLPGATLLPLGSLAKGVGSIPRHHPVVVYCRSGRRSAQAIERLQTEFGFANLLNLDGGLEAWTELEAEKSTNNLGAVA